MAKITTTRPLSPSMAITPQPHLLVTLLQRPATRPSEPRWPVFMKLLLIATELLHKPPSQIVRFLGKDVSLPHRLPVSILGRRRPGDQLQAPFVLRAICTGANGVIPDTGAPTDGFMGWPVRALAGGGAIARGVAAGAFGERWGRIADGAGLRIGS